MFLKRVSQPSLAVALCVALLSTLFPATALAAPVGKPREYIVTLSVAGSERAIAPSSRSARQNIRQRASRAREATQRVAREHGVKVGHRYGYAFTGFSATMTPAQARRIAADPSVVDVRVARTFRIAAQEHPRSVARVKALPGGGGAVPEVNVNVAIVDTGVGPAEQNGNPIPMTTNELNIEGGVNCYNPDAPLGAEGWWGDTYGHGTHVAGIVGARDNGVGTIGVAPGARLWSARVFQGRSGSETAVACGIDWAVKTRTTGPAADAIDVINLSIEGSRLDYREDCANVTDPMQVAVCNATAAGIVVVAAAGNWGGNANDSAPGGFDEVISVGAMTDTDGAGWGQGPNATCFGSNEQDDEYASYSNHGREVDIVAPGTCVRSTAHQLADGAPSSDGDRLVTMTGTSMAAPHVTGAVARYIAAHGRLTDRAGVDRVRRVVRAAGRMDWDVRTDPVWYGVSDPDPPNRLVDVKALEAGSLVRAWVYHSKFRVGRSSTSRTTRVDVQRGGGYAGAVDLSLTGLPGTAGSHEFDRDRLTGLGRNALGTNLRLSLKKSALAQGEYVLDIGFREPGVAAQGRLLRLLIDRTGPAISGLHARLRGGNAPMTRKGAAQVFIKWQVEDVLSGVKWARLQRRNGGSAWREAGVGGLEHARVTLKRGQLSRFRVKAADKLGNKRTSHVISARLSVRDSRSSQWQKPAGEWRTKRVRKAFGGSILLAAGPTDSLTTTFKGKAVAVVASVGPSRGTLRVRIDGGPWNTISLTSGKAGHRKVVWTRLVPKTEHLLEVQGVSGQSTLDAVLIVR